jgi:three-Cys-motif partner protein
MNELNSPGKIPRPIKRWTCHKLECFTDYIDAYARSLANDCYYLEMYAGCGQCLCNGTDCCIDDSALRALRKKFTRHVFVIRDSQDAEYLNKLATARYGNKIDIINGNCNNLKTIRQLLDLIPRSASSFAFIDPPGYRMLRWKTVERLARHGKDWQGKKMDLLIVFPVEMALLRNLTRTECESSINRLYGGRKWQKIRQEKLDSNIELDDTRHRLVGLFKDNLSRLGYRYVADFKPVAFSRSPFYHLIWASDRRSGTEILEETWGKQRYLPCELLYHPRTDQENEQNRHYQRGNNRSTAGSVTKAKNSH